MSRRATRIRKLWVIAAALLGAGYVAGAGAGAKAEPRTVQLGAQMLAPEQQALILGQSYRASKTDATHLLIIAVDGRSTTGEAGWKSTVNYRVPPGTRTFDVAVIFGRNDWVKSPSEKPLGKPVQFSSEVQAGQVYQMYVKRGYHEGRRYVKLWLERIGTLEEYEAFRQRHPKRSGGIPLSQDEMLTR